jgi:hypothetical protein
MSQPPAAPTPPPSRLYGIDVVRGLFMVMITCSHARLQLAGHERLSLVASYLLSGTVGFVTLSGTLIGWFAETKRVRYPAIAARYRVQAGRLILAHPVVALALFSSSAVGLVGFTTRTVYVTDVLAVLFVAVVPVIPRMAPRARLAIGVVALVVTPLISLLPGEGAVIDLLRELCCGVDPLRHHALLSNFGLLPIGGMFLIGSWLGYVVARAGASAGGLAALAPWLRRAAAGLVALGGALVGGWMIARQLTPASSVIRHVLYPTYEGALYPFYLAEVLLWLSLTLPRRTLGSVSVVLALIGQASLFAYLLQYFLVETIPYELGWRGSLSPPAFAAFVVGALALLVVAVALWRRLTPVRASVPATPEATTAVR